MRHILLAAALFGLAACTSEEMEVAMEDPGAFACRERASARTGMDFSQTGSRPINRDFMGIGNYDVFAGGETYRCVVDEDDSVLSFERI